MIRKKYEKPATSYHNVIQRIYQALTEEEVAQADFGYRETTTDEKLAFLIEWKINRIAEHKAYRIEQLNRPRPESYLEYRDLIAKNESLTHGTPWQDMWLDDIGETRLHDLRTKRNYAAITLILNVHDAIVDWAVTNQEGLKSFEVKMQDQLLTQLYICYRKLIRRAYK